MDISLAPSPQLHKHFIIEIIYLIWTSKAVKCIIAKSQAPSDWKLLSPLLKGTETFVTKTGFVRQVAFQERIRLYLVHSVAVKSELFHYFITFPVSGIEVASIGVIFASFCKNRWHILSSYYSYNYQKFADMKMW